MLKAEFNRMELAGSVGDLGALLPLAFAMILINGMSVMGFLIGVGAFYILGGLYYRVPIAVQPMKVVAAYSIALGLSPQEITASGILLAALLLFLGLTGLVNKVAKITPKAVIRGVQGTTGILLFSKGIALIIGTNTLQTTRNAVEPFLSLQSIGPVPLSLIIGIGFALLTFCTINSKKYPAGILIILCGGIIGASLGAWHAVVQIDLGFHLPQLLPFGLPTTIDYTYVLFALALPQAPMTIGNAVIANRDLNDEYFGKNGSRGTSRALCISMGLANCFSALIGGIPMCHGAGGLAAHYRFGSRTNGSNLIIGSIFLALALFCGNQAIAVLQLVPMGALGVLLVYTGIQLALSIIDMRKREDLAVVIVILGVSLTTNLAWGFGVGIVLHALLRTKRFSL